MVAGFVIILVAVLLSACSTTVEQAAPTPEAPPSVSPEPLSSAPTEPGPDTIPFHLDVTNQSFDEPEVHLRIWLDGHPIIDGVFPVEDQHHVVRHDLHLAPGHHEVRVAEQGTAFDLTDSFALQEEAWANVSYWGSSGNGPRLDWQFSLEKLEYG